MSNSRYIVRFKRQLKFRGFISFMIWAKLSDAIRSLDDDICLFRIVVPCFCAPLWPVIAFNPVDF